MSKNMVMFKKTIDQDRLDLNTVVGYVPANEKTTISDTKETVRFFIDVFCGADTIRLEFKKEKVRNKHIAWLDKKFNTHTLDGEV